MKLIVEARRVEAATSPSSPCSISPAGSISSASASARWRCWPAPAPSTCSTATAHRVLDSLDALVGYSAAIHDQRASAQVSLFGEAGDDLPEPRLCAGGRLAADRAARRGAQGDRLLPLRPPARRLPAGAEAQGRADAGRGDDEGRARAAGGQDGRRRLRRGRSANRRAATALPSSQLSDPTGLYEVTLFSDTLEAARDHLETGRERGAHGRGHHGEPTSSSCSPARSRRSTPSSPRPAAWR